MAKFVGGSLIIDFEDEVATATPPFRFNPGALTQTPYINRGGSRFDIVTNIKGETKTLDFGQRSLDPFYDDSDSTPFTIDLGVPSGERGVSLYNFVSITMGDYGEDTDYLSIRLQPFPKIVSTSIIVLLKVKDRTCWMIHPMTCYSEDFRQKIIEAYEQGESSVRELAKRFLVCPDTVQRLLTQYRSTGNIRPKKCGSQRQSVLSQHEAVALQVVEDHPDWALWQYCEVLTEQLGVNVSTSMMGRFCQQHHLTLKKKRTGARR